MDLARFVDHWLKFVVCREQRDGAAFGRIGLDRGFFAGDTGNNDLAVLGGIATRYDDIVTVVDAGVDHRGAPNPQHVELAFARELRWERHELLDVLMGQDVGTGGHVADEGHVGNRSPFDHGARVRVVAHFDRPRFSGVTA